MDKYALDTILAQAGNRNDKQNGAVSAPIMLSTVYAHYGVEDSINYDYDYSRTKNPTRLILENTIAQLDGGKKAFAFASGMAAIDTILTLFKAEDEILISKDIYGGSFRLFNFRYQNNNFAKPIYVDTSSIEQINSKINQNTKAIFIETPSNPIMKESDIAEIAKITKQHNLLLIVDNTFLTPALFRPIEFGADLVIYSASKYLAGHNDVLAGIVVANDENLCEQFGFLQRSCGAVLSPFDSWLTIRGLKTLSLRMQKHQENTKKIAEFLKKQSFIKDVYYPNKGGMLSFRLINADLVDPFLKALKIISFAGSLGGTESFISYPFTQSHRDLNEQQRQEFGVCNALLRFSVGIEDAEDIKNDLSQAFNKALKTTF